MTQILRRVQRWAPHLLAVIFLALVGLFTFGEFGDYPTRQAALVALASHMIPTFVLLSVVLVMARYWVAGISLLLIVGLFAAIALGLETVYLMAIPPTVLVLLVLWDVLVNRSWRLPNK